MNIQTTANGQALCHKCMLAEQLKVSQEYRPLVCQWVVYEPVSVRYASKIHCFKCSKSC